MNTPGYISIYLFRGGRDTEVALLGIIIIPNN